MSDLIYALSNKKKRKKSLLLKKKNEDITDIGLTIEKIMYNLILNNSGITATNLQSSFLFLCKKTWRIIIPQSGVLTNSFLVLKGRRTIFWASRRRLWNLLMFVSLKDHNSCPIRTKIGWNILLVNRDFEYFTLKIGQSEVESNHKML